jgi:hypothetical protein
MKFSPTKQQIFTAQQLFIAMAYRDMVVQEFERMNNELLESGTYHYDDEYYSNEWKKKGLFCPPDRIIRSALDINMISGLLMTQAPGYEKTDSYRFYNELAKKASDAGFKHGRNALDIAVNEVAGYEDKLIESTYDIHKLELNQLLNPKDRHNLLNLLIGLFSHVVEDESFEVNQKIFYNERMTSKVRSNFSYSDNEQSFRFFRSLKRLIPLVEFVPNDRIIFFNGVEGVLLYEHPYCIFQIKEGETWEYNDFKTTSCKYVFVNSSNEIFESNDLEPVERHLFKDFIKGQVK